MTSPHTVVIGDIGGHLDALRHALSFAALDTDTLALPPHVSVVSLGDLIDRGPSSLECLTLMRRVQQANPNQVIQLIGNHEANWLEAYHVFVSRSGVLAGTEDATTEYLREWVASAPLYLAACVDTPRPTLLTHAGVTRGLWEDIAKPTDVLATTQRINDLWYSPLHTLVTKAGTRLGNARTTHAGVYWAEAGHELCEGWLEADMPFDQVHGHSSCFDWENERWWAPPSVEEKAFLDTEKKHVRVTIGNHSITGIDPCLGKESSLAFQPLILEGAARVAGSPVVDLFTERRTKAFAAL